MARRRKRKEELKIISRVTKFTAVAQPNYTWKELEAPNLMGLTNFGEKMNSTEASIVSPSGDTPHERAIVLHELSHAKLTNDIRSAAKKAAKHGCSNMSIQITEDIRIHETTHKKLDLFRKNEAYIPDIDLMELHKNDSSNWSVKSLALRFIALRGYPVENDWDTTNLSEFLKRAGGECDPDIFSKVEKIGIELGKDLEEAFAKKRPRRFHLNDQFIDLANSVEGALRKAFIDEEPNKEPDNPGEEEGNGEENENPNNNNEPSEDNKEEDDKVEEKKKPKSKSGRAEVRDKGKSPIDRVIPDTTQYTVSESMKEVPSIKAKMKPGGPSGPDLGGHINPEYSDDMLDDYALETKINWGEMDIGLGPLSRHFKAKVPSNSGRAGVEGLIPRHYTRWFSDRAIMDMKSKKATGTLLIDVSGSMSWAHETTLKLIELCPAATIALYSSHKTGGKGVLTIIAKHGKAVPKGWCPHTNGEHGGGNYCDGNALAWLVKQKGPRIWFSDTVVTCPNSENYDDFSMAAAKDAFRLCLLGAITVTMNVKNVIDIFAGKKRADPIKTNPAAGTDSDYETYRRGLINKRRMRI